MICYGYSLPVLSDVIRPSLNTLLELASKPLNLQPNPLLSLV